MFKHSKRHEIVLRHLHGNVSDAYLDFIIDMVEIDKSWRDVKREHHRYKNYLRRKLNDIPHVIEQQIKTMDRIHAIHLILETSGCTLRESNWFYNYLVSGRIQWFMPN